MSESFPPPPEQQPATAPEADAGKRTGLVRFVPRSRGVRWAALGAAVVIVGGTAAAAVVAGAEHHHLRADGGPRLARFEAGPGAGHGGGPGGQGPHRQGPGEQAPGDRGGHPAEQRGGGWKEHGGGAAKQAPAPLPSLAIGDAADKAAAAVSGGKVESLRVVGQQGGGSAWLAVVIGPDGVRHAVTVSGTDGTITGNVTAPGRR
uniref:PepSY domain-containing protein n=1 Tax=Streptomyces sp. NBC_00049 TaxID=2903617 RepID=A0AAU2K3A6_9ACTN